MKTLKEWLEIKKIETSEMPCLSVQAVLSNRLYKFIRVPELVSGSVMPPRLPLLSFYFAILAMLAFFLGLVFCGQQLT